MPFWKRSELGNKPSDTEPLRCSFCNKDQNEVAKLIAGPTVYICDECVSICVDIMTNDTRAGNAVMETSKFSKTSVPTVDPAVVPAAESTADCAMCHAPVPVSTGLTIPGRGLLCAECEELVVLAVENRWPVDE